jgi:phosphopantothenoylcysteine decarboxylase/phosphopantothenate--cysteine ligase
MGVALAEEARLRGAEVTLVAANLAVPAPGKIEVVAAPTAAELERAVLERADADIVVMAAAVADYRPSEPAATKRPKDGNGWTVRLEPTEDVLAELGVRRRPGQILVGFAADGGEGGLERARQKLERKRTDLIVFNDVSRDDIGFDAADNEVVLVTTGDERRIRKAPKERIAGEIMDEVVEMLERDGRPA